MVIPYFKQKRDYNCGPAVFRMALASFGINKNEKELAKLLKTNTKEGTKNRNFSTVADHFDLDYIVKKNASVSDIKNFSKKGYAVILAYIYPKENVGHFAVLRKIDSKHIHLLDPLVGPKHKYLINDFKQIWKSGFEKDIRWLFAVRK